MTEPERVRFTVELEGWEVADDIAVLPARRSVSSASYLSGGVRVVDPSLYQAIIDAYNAARPKPRMTEPRETYAVVTASTKDTPLRREFVRFLWTGGKQDPWFDQYFEFNEHKRWRTWSDLIDPEPYNEENQ